MNDIENSVILVVDDDHDIVNAISALLEREGFKTYKAYNGIEAVDVRSTSTPSLVTVGSLES